MTNCSPNSAKRRAARLLDAALEFGLRSARGGRHVKNTIIYLIGHYGVGKLTVGQGDLCPDRRAPVRQPSRPTTSSSRSSVRTAKDAIARRAWDLIIAIRDQAFTAIEG